MTGSITIVKKYYIFALQVIIETIGIPYFSKVIKKYAISKQICRKFAKLQICSPPLQTEFPPLFMCCNIHHFGITKRKVMASKRQVMASKLQVTASKLQVMASKLQVTASKLQVTPTILPLTRSKLTSLTAETNKFQLTNMLYS